MKSELREHIRIKADVSDLPAGIYFYQMKTGFFNESKKLIVIR
jgi:hypothetical protein